MKQPPNNRQEQIPTNRPRVINDPTGFWGAVFNRNDEQWNGLLPPGTLIQLDQNRASEMLQGTVKYVPVKVRWGNVEFNASLEDGQSTAILQSGGVEADGTVTILASKSDPAFNGSGWPTKNDELELQIRDKWKVFQIKAIVGEFNQLDDAITFILEPEDSR